MNGLSNAKVLLFLVFNGVSFWLALEIRRSDLVGVLSLEVLVVVSRFLSTFSIFAFLNDFSALEVSCLSVCLLFSLLLLLLSSPLLLLVEESLVELVLLLSLLFPWLFPDEVEVVVLFC